MSGNRKLWAAHPKSHPLPGVADELGWQGAAQSKVLARAALGALSQEGKSEVPP